jgi:hypothetical protein
LSDAFESFLTATATADASHPDRQLTPEERAHLGLDSDTNEEQK